MALEILWPWLAVAAAGALHGVNPATGWVFAAWRTQPARRVHTLGLLVPIAAGHLGSIAIVAAAVPAAVLAGVEFDPLVPQGLAVAALLGLGASHLLRRGRGAPPARTGALALTLWSVVVGIAHGAGWMLMPALASICAAGMPAREITASGSLGLALAAIGLHMAAMLAATAAMGIGARRAAQAGAAYVQARRATAQDLSSKPEGQPPPSQGALL